YSFFSAWSIVASSLHIEQSRTKQKRPMILSFRVVRLFCSFPGLANEIRDVIMEGPISGVMVDMWLLAFNCGFVECAFHIADDVFTVGDVFTVSVGVDGWR